MDALGAAHGRGRRPVRGEFHTLRARATLLTHERGEVQLVDVVKRFGEVSAVDGIIVEIPGGEFFGRILLDGVDMAHTPRGRARAAVATSA
jgi:hypothetical protein